MRQLLKKLLSYLPSKLPIGMQEFNEFSSEVIQLSGKFADEDSMKFAIASQMMHLGPQTSSISKQFFIRSLRKAAANQVASQVFQDIKIKQQQMQEEAKKLAEQNKEDTLSETQPSEQKEA